MIQFYLLSVLYLVLASGLLLVDKYGSTVFFLINLKTFYNSKKLIQIICLSVGAVILLGVIFFPVNPGPMVLGDLLPAINLAVVLFYFVRKVGKTDIVDYNNEKRNALGFITLGVALIHLLFPSIVII
ncbi:MAG: hypothetical protein IKS77_06350 [Spirochaetales bacterium]|nr:hypothetical protein [Spirochaetales bacterium]